MTTARAWVGNSLTQLIILEHMSYARDRDFPRALALANAMADAARAIARGYFRQPIEVERKADLSPVTVADRAIETEMRRLIRAEFPGHGIRGEEFAAEAGAGYTWVLDPIDGTKSFVTGFPLFGSLIALERNERAVLGIIETPALGERWVGAEGLATTFNGVAARTSACSTLEQARVYCTSAEAFRADELQRYERCTRRALLRRYGGDCYIYGLLASGHCDLVIETALKPHDFQALVPVIEGAGGRISDWEGQPLSARSGERVVAAATAALWAQAIAALSGP
jgi:inositol-phosphate phosphatase / L-galactose 1-phosphate phosphatase / histidinol-phosphatase